MRADLLLRRDQLDELAEFAAQIAPAALDVLDQRLGLVLRQYRDLTDAGIDAIRQDEIDDAELAAEWGRRFAAMLRQRLEPLAASSRHDHRQSAARQSADIASGVITSSVSHILQPDHTRSDACTWFLAGAAFARLSIMSALKLSVLSSEILPYAKTGGLADVAGALVQNLRLKGHEVHAFMPLYSAVRAAHPELQPVLGLQKIPLGIGGTEYRFSVQTAQFPRHRHRDLLRRLPRPVRPSRFLHARCGRTPALSAVHARGARKLPAAWDRDRTSFIATIGTRHSCRCT